MIYLFRSHTEDITHITRMMRQYNVNMPNWIGIGTQELTFPATNESDSDINRINTLHSHTNSAFGLEEQLWISKCCGRVYATTNLATPLASLHPVRTLVRIA